LKINSKKLPNRNEQITASEVRVIDQDGKMLGVLSLTEALMKARSENLDLMEIDPNSVPPVCKILDSGKHLYDLKKKSQNLKKKNKVIELKEIKFRPNTGAHDLNFKIKAIEKFLKRGEKVKISLKFKGREISHHEIGMELINKVIESVLEYGSVESPPKIENFQITAVLVTKKPH
jgi:translation initiation factor IF-3